MKHYLKVCIDGIIAGVLIGIGALIYLSLFNINKIVGSLFFPVGLYLIIQFSFFLYTGKVGYLFDNKPKYILDLLVGLLSNFLGIFSIAFIVSFTRMSDLVSPVASALVQTKQSDSWISILILSILCGFMIYLAVEGKKIENKFGQVLVCFLCVSIFILCGFEHCVANVFYYTLAKAFDAKGIFYFVLMIIGNGIGSVILNFLFKFSKKLSN